MVDKTVTFIVQQTVYDDAQAEVLDSSSHLTVEDYMVNCCEKLALTKRMKDAQNSQISSIYDAIQIDDLVTNPFGTE